MARACRLVLVLLFIWGAVLLPEMTPRFVATILHEWNLTPADIDSGDPKKPLGAVMGGIANRPEPSPNPAAGVPNRQEERLQPGVATTINSTVHQLDARLILPEDLILEAVDDLYTIDMGTTLKVAAPGLLANDRAAAGVRLRALLAAPPRNGELALKPDGSFAYTPDEDFSGIDRFTYRAVDGVRQSAPATVAITVREIIPEPAVSSLAELEVSISAFTGPRIAAITDFSETVNGVRLVWEKAYYQDLDIAGSTPLEIPFGLNRPFGYNQNSTTRYPLVIYLHGAGARSNWANSSSDPDRRDHTLVNAALKRKTARFFARAAQTQSLYHAFVLAPQVPSKSHLWVGKGPDVPYKQTNTSGNTYSEYMHLLENLLPFLISSANNSSLERVLGIDANDIDLERIYVVGDSDGAKGTWDILARKPSLFARAIASAGTGPRNRLTELRKTPLWTIHGILDDAVPNQLPSSSKPYGSGTLGMLALLDSSFDNTGSTNLIYRENHAVSGDDPIPADRLIYSEFESSYNHSYVSTRWTGATSGILPWLFAQGEEPASGTVLFSDTFNRSDGGTVGNGWTEAETTGAAVGIGSSRLFFIDTSDVTNRPMVFHGFSKVSSGKLFWEFDFNWTRTGSEGGYRLFMQLGDGALMSTSSQDAGVGVNLIWTVIGGAHEQLGYRRGGINTRLATLRGSARISVEADLGTHTYRVAVGGATVGTGIPFDRIADLNTVRFFTDRLSEQSYSGRSFDDLVIRR